MPETAAWSVADTLLLIELWSEENIQKQLDGAKRNERVYQDIAKLMEERGTLRFHCPAASSSSSPSPASPGLEPCPATPVNQAAHRTSTPALPGPTINPRAILGRRKGGHSDVVGYLREADTATTESRASERSEDRENRAADRAADREKEERQAAADREKEERQAAERAADRAIQAAGHTVARDFNNQFIVAMGQIAQALRGRHE